MAGGGPDQEKPVDVFEALASTVDFLSMLAWQKMGLQPDMATGKIDTDFKQAKAAVDAVSSLVAVLEPALDDPADKRNVQNLVRDLKVNYLEKVGGMQ